MRVPQSTLALMNTRFTTSGILPKPCIVSPTFMPFRMNGYLFRAGRTIRTHFSRSHTPWQLGSKSSKERRLPIRSPTTHDIPVQVNANPSVYLYRKCTRYRIRVHFKLDANDWNQSRTVGAWRQGSAPLVGEYEIYVNTRDVLVVTDSLSGTSVLEGPGLNGPPSSPTIQPWDRGTRKCTSWLHWSGF
ncbi:uncharacterized protein EI90DRAFT_3060057 [Cantharellus anzutake]|uniref:uncharacterized protein n=1 Tax=Cantharellus anzutake TaxID=1750568 RepID=UPI0019034122|nr:uncharacterized protein EI90DRAFT_3060057 [Cantharellus anzutake]KAF8330587.1 hypothetical protein EI90DRAFT_3060057 [Cantharellus anzutake]